ncbi:hypothetical protein SAMN04488498_104322 [Mesorhizobium albiziae]|uniref:Uncharacterized protein n=1 Tax=Neomesorhizobium albiziae TaxID=335020 RepID=A0A1I3YCE6_9HYPH|nr:hypothetical protein [Mesorhizobium albiziae]GLS29973.1 hypothetical protein GCM10007937_16810 [Mesorhizobium albiziae]SFK29049.1 hypothetical protein SAMN04488498_104322 [Mesorhizobium albiziae]
MIGGAVLAVAAPLLSRFAAPLAFAGGLAAATACGAAWDRFVDDPAVAAAARGGFVQRSEKVAAEAELAATRRQLADVRAARDRFALILAHSQAAASRQVERMESGIVKNEKKLAEDGREWRLDRADIEWLLKP